jgi:leucyl aminopeptidase (aminopeptidase T)
MIKDIEVLNKHSQIRELGSELRYNILRELIRGAATCQQLAHIYGISKQKVHYNLNKLLEENLIEIVPSNQNRVKEVYYRATAKNFVLDFAIGQNINDHSLNTRDIIDNILTQEYHMNLNSVAAKLLDDSLKMKPQESLLIVSGRYNQPLVEKILIEAGRRSIFTTWIYQPTEILKAKYEEYSLAAFDADYKQFNRLLAKHNVYLNLNGEARYLELEDPQKQRLRVKHFSQSRKIISQNKIKIAIMPGLLPHTLEEKALESEIQFWKALDIDYKKLYQRTHNLCADMSRHKTIRVSNSTTGFTFNIQKILAECGSFGYSEFQSPTINLPGGEILLIPEPDSLNGEITGDLAYISGKIVERPWIRFINNKIAEFKAESNEELMKQAIMAGGKDGATVALVCLGTNENVHLTNIDSSYKHKCQGLLTVYWGENISLGGNVAGENEWYIQIENPQLSYL